MSEESQVWANQVAAMLPMILPDGTVLNAGPNGYAVHNGKIYQPLNDGRGGFTSYDNYLGPDGNGKPVLGQTPIDFHDSTGAVTHQGVHKSDNPGQLLALAALAAGGMAFGLPALMGGQAAGAGAAAGIPGTAFGDAGLMYAGADAAAANSLLSAPLAASVAPAVAPTVAGGGVLSSLGGWGTLFSSGASLVSGLVASNAARDASGNLIASGDRAIAEQQRQFETVQKLLAPYVAAGTGNLQRYQDLVGSNGTAPQRAAIDELVAGPEFAHLIKQGENAILQNASATGGLRGGNVQAGLMDFRADQTAKLIDRQLARYMGLTELGQSSAAGVGKAGMTTGALVGNILQKQGAAEAGADIAGANALIGSIGNVGGILASRLAAGKAF